MSLMEWKGVAATQMCTDEGRYRQKWITNYVLQGNKVDQEAMESSERLW